MVHAMSDREILFLILEQQEAIMAAIDDLKALEPRLDAVIAALNTDTATAVANAVAPLNEQIASLQSAATNSEAALATEVANITPKVVALETGVGITFTPPAVA
jgi:hypothetical protein